MRLKKPKPRTYLKSAFWFLVAHDVRLVARRSGGWVALLLFFFISGAMFPALSGVHSIAMLWLSVIFCGTLALNRMFVEEYENGVLEQLLLQPIAPHVLIVAKAMSHFLLVMVPMGLLSFMLVGGEVLPFLISLLFGMPALSLFGAGAAAFALGLPRSGFVLAMLVTPVYALVYFVAVQAAQASDMTAYPFLLQLMALFGLGCAGLAFAALAGSRALRVTLE